MNFDEIIGFIISILAFIFFFGKPIYDAWQKKKHPEEYAKKESENAKRLRQFKKMLEGDMEDVKDDDEEEEEKPIIIPQKQQKKKYTPPPPKHTPRTVHDEFRFKTKMDSFQQRTAVEQRRLNLQIDDRYAKDLGADVTSSDMMLQNYAKAYEHKTRGPARGRKLLLQKLPSRKDIMTIHAIFTQPKGLQ